MYRTNYTNMYTHTHIILLELCCACEPEKRKVVFENQKYNNNNKETIKTVCQHGQNGPFIIRLY